MTVPSSIRFSDDVSIGDWPCLAEITMSVLSSRPRRVARLTIVAELASTKSSASRSSGPGTQRPPRRR